MSPVLLNKRWFGRGPSQGAEQNVRQSKGVAVPSSLPAALTTGAGMNRKFRQQISKANLSSLHVWASGTPSPYDLIT